MAVKSIDDAVEQNFDHQQRQENLEDSLGGCEKFGIRQVAQLTGKTVIMPLGCAKNT